MKTTTRHVLLTIGFPWALLLSAPTQAAFLSAYEGYSVFGQQCELCDSTVSFAVWENTDGNWLDETELPNSTDLPGFNSTGTEKYVYLYQIVNTNPLGTANREEDLRNFNISYGPQDADKLPSPYQSAGYFSQHRFTNVSSALSPIDVPNDGVPSQLANMGGLTQDNSVVDPAGLSFNYILAPAVGGIYPGAAFQWDFGTTIEPDEMSAVLYLTSDYAPMFRWAETESIGGSSAAGDVPSVVPLPTSVWLFGASLIAVISLARRRSA
jgi:hypothetical protein